MPHATGGKSNRYSYWKWVQYYDTQRAWAFTWLSKVFLEIRGAKDGDFYFYPKNYLVQKSRVTFLKKIKCIEYNLIELVFQ